MNKTEAESRIKHVVRSLLRANISIEAIRSLTDTAITEVKKEMFYTTRKN